MADQTRAEEVFKKSREQMSETERMMADIMSKASESSATENTSPEQEKSQILPAPPKVARRTARKKGFVSRELPNTTPEKTPDEDADMLTYVPPQKPEKKTSAEPAHSANSQRKKSKRRKKKSGPQGVILVLCLLVIVGVLAFNYSLKDLFTQQTETIDNPAVTEPPDLVIPSPETGDSEGTLPSSADDAIVILSGTPEATPTPEPTPSEKPGTKRFFQADVSWKDAQSDCEAMGGHLVTISDADELAEVIALAEEAGVDKVWVGCHRENGELAWENGETIDTDSLNAWDTHEPSYYDSGDNVYEDYLLLWKRNGRWCFNDSRNDPVADYPYMYSGMIGYVCEFD